MPTTPWTVDWLKEVYLFGVKLEYKGVAYPDSMFAQALASAQEWLKNQLSIAIPKATYVERHDLSRAEWGEFWLLNVDNCPVRSVTGIKLKVATTQVFDCPSDWIMQPKGFESMVQAVPTANTSVVLSGAVYAAQVIAMMHGHGRLPGWYEITYSAGWDTAEMPADLLDLGGKYAAMYPLNTAGDLIAGAGIASKSVSLDGASQSVGTTSSATNAGYGARILQYHNDIKRDLPMIRRKYHGIPMVAV